MHGGNFHPGTGYRSDKFDEVTDHPDDHIYTSDLLCPFRRAVHGSLTKAIGGPALEGVVQANNVPHAKTLKDRWQSIIQLGLQL